jgi:hypothetical protein
MTRNSQRRRKLGEGRRKKTGGRSWEKTEVGRREKNEENMKRLN